MNRIEYAAYEKAVAAFFEREGLENLSFGSIDHNYNGECTNKEHSHDCNGDYTQEPYFSWQPCDCCGSTVGGNREDCIGWNPTTRKVQGNYSVCLDCVYYSEYGQLDDLAMLEIDLVCDDT